MGLYLAVFDNDEEVAGVEVGSYADFNYFRDLVVNKLENGHAGSRFPTLILHSDCDGEWTAQQAAKIETELETIGASFRELPPVPLGEHWQQEVAKSLGIAPGNLYECCFDIDGEPLIERLLELVLVSQKRGCRILFQ